MKINLKPALTGEELSLAYAKGGALLSTTIGVTGKIVEEIFDLPEMDQIIRRVTALGLLFSSIHVQLAAYRGVISKSPPNRELVKKVHHTAQSVTYMMMGIYFCFNEDPASRSFIAAGLASLAICTILTKMASSK